MFRRLTCQPDRVKSCNSKQLVLYNSSYWFTHCVNIERFVECDFLICKALLWLADWDSWACSVRSYGIVLAFILGVTTNPLQCVGVPYLEQCHCLFPVPPTSLVRPWRWLMFLPALSLSRASPPAEGIGYDQVSASLQPHSKVILVGRDDNILEDEMLTTQKWVSKLILIRKEMGQEQQHRLKPNRALIPALFINATFSHKTSSSDQWMIYLTQ